MSQLIFMPIFSIIRQNALQLHSFCNFIIPQHCFYCATQVC